MAAVPIAIAGASAVSGLLGKNSAKKAAKSSERATQMTVEEQRRQFDLVRGDTAPARELGKNAIGTISQLYGYGGASPAPLTFEQWSAQQQRPQYPGGGSLGGAGRWGGIMGRDMTIPGKPAGDLKSQYQAYLAAQPHNTGKPDMSAFFTSPDYQFRLDQGNQAITNSAAAQGGLLSGAAVKAGERYSSNLASGEYGAFFDRLLQQAGLGTTGIGASAAAGANSSNNIGNAYMNNAANKSSAYAQGAGAINSAVQGGLSNWMLSQYLGGGGGGSYMNGGA